MEPARDITRILKEHREGKREAARELLPVVYDELRRLAADYMKRERPDHTLQATALVHEAYLRLVDQKSVDWQGRNHFFSVAARMIPRVLVDHARRRLARKRGGEYHRVSLEGVLSPGDGLQAEVDAVALAESLEKLSEHSERQARVVELRFFAGLNVEETANELGVSADTVKRDWRFARAWLSRCLRESE